jgi:sulfite exporter TauE/SafE
MSVLFATVFLASLLGSLHCAGMCGPLVAIAAGQALPSGAGAPAGIPLRVLNASRNHLAYNFGRLCIYCSLGAISGAVGAAIDLGGALIGAQRVAAAAAGLIMVAFGLATLARAAGFRVAAPAVPSGLRQFWGSLHRVAVARRPVLRAAAFGLLSGLLPCGWLYAFVLIAGGTASPFVGALTMLGFWLGTLPIMLSLGFGLQALLGRMTARVPILTSLALIAIGLITLSWRMELPSNAIAGSTAKSASFEQSIEQVTQVDSNSMPCCHSEWK